MVKSDVKILLINPVTKTRERVLRVERCQQKLFRPVGIWPPVNLLEIALYLRHNGFQNVEIIDAEIEKLSFEGLLAMALNKDPGMVVIQATTPTISDDLSFASRLKKKSGGIASVFIGLHATVFPEDLLKDEAVDYAVLGEPEEVVSELALHLFRSEDKLNNIPGLGYKVAGNIYVNNRRMARDSYDYPIMPDRSLLKNDRYIMPLTGRPFTVVKVSRGCDFSCPFCTSAAYYGKGWKARSPENIIEEIKEARDKHGIDSFIFLSDTFNNNKDFVDKLTRLIIEEDLNIKWVSNSRVDLVNEESVALMKKSGCLLVSLGIESYDEGVLKANKKSLTKECVGRALAIFKKYGILTYGYFIFGLEKESKMSIIRTALSAFKSELDFGIFYSLTPYPGTDYFGRYNNHAWRGYFHGTSDIVWYPHLSKEAIGLATRLATILFYLKPQRIFLAAKYLIQKRLC